MPSVLTPAAVSMETKAASRLVAAESEGALGMASNISSKASTLMFALPIVGGVLGWLAKRETFARVAKPLEKVHQVSNLTSASLESLPQEVAAVFGNTHAVTNAVKNAGGGIATYANRILGTSQSGSKVLDKVGKSSVSNAVFAGASATRETAATVLGFKHSLNALQHMQEDLTGKKATKMDILRGKDLHPLVMEARKEATGLRSGIGTLLRVAGVIGNIYMMIFSEAKGIRYFGQSMAIDMGTSMAANLATTPNTALTGYRSMQQNFAHHGQATLENYEHLISGLAKKASEGTVKEVAQKAFEAQLTPHKVLKMVYENYFLKKTAPVTDISTSAHYQENQRPKDAVGQTAGEKASATAPPPVTIGSRTFTSNQDKGPLAAKFDPAVRPNPGMSRTTAA